MWQYDIDEVHPEVQSRLLRRFDTFDIDGDNCMTLTEVKVVIENISFSLFYLTFRYCNITRVDSLKLDRDYQTLHTNIQQ